MDGAVKRPFTLTYAQLTQLSLDTRLATLDCTGGWYTTQTWNGIELRRLLQMAAVHDEASSVTVRSVSGYQRRFSLSEANTFLLALKVAGQPLSHGHGSPARLVAVGRRGLEWVKWVSHIQVNTTSRLWQMPLPLR